jgi:heptosyltransferase-1
VEEGFAAIPELHPRVACVVPIALRRWRARPFAPTTWRELRAAKARLRAAHYDLVIDCQGLLKSAWVASWTRSRVVGPDGPSARVRWAAYGYARRVAVPTTMHAIERNRHLAGTALDYVVRGKSEFGARAPALVVPELVDIVAAGPIAVLLTNASRASKLWPAPHWRAVEGALAARGLRSVLVWGSAGEESATRERAHGMRQARVIARATLPQLAALLARARIVVGLDTGLTHLAAALGVATVGIFCDYDPRLVGVTGDGRCASIGGALGGPGSDEAIATIAAIVSAVDAGRG